MRYTDTEGRLLLAQLRKARDELARAKLMLAAVSTDADAEDGAVDEMAEMVAVLNGIIDSIVKADLVDDEDEAEGK